MSQALRLPAARLCFARASLSRSAVNVAPTSAQQHRATSCINQNSVRFLASRYQVCEHTTTFTSRSNARSQTYHPRRSMVATYASATKAAVCTGSSAVKDLRVTAEETAPGEWVGDLLALGVFEEALTIDDETVTISDETLKALDEASDGVISELMAETDFKGAPGSTACCRVGGNYKRVLLVGLGKAENSSVAAWKSMGTTIGKTAKECKAKIAAAAVIGPLGEDQKEAAVKGLTLGACLGSFQDFRFKAKGEATKLSDLRLLQAVSGNQMPWATSIIDETKAMAYGVVLTMQLVNAPPNVATPSMLAETAEAIAAEFKTHMKCKILEQKDCEALGMGAYLGVAMASDEPPKFIHLTYSPPEGASTKLGIVGKGLTFDSGGYNLKAGAGSMIEMMKFDMGGSAAVLGAARAVGEMAPPGVEVHFIIAACENMVSGRGMRPGDILTASNGKTIEVNNTDAEGRLTLADALVYAEKEGVEKVVDIATLTGACMVALGGDIAGLFTPHDELSAALCSASSSMGEKLWRLPMEASYMKQLDSPIADMKNTGTRMGGSITAALFLQEFVSKDLQWAHLDIAGPVWDEKANCATGFGAATLAQWVQSHSPVSHPAAEEEEEED